MSMIPETDRVIRNFLPTVLDAAGQSGYAQELRDLSPIHDLKSIIAAANRLQDLSEFIQMEGQDIDPRWKCLVEDSLFWCEAAACAAIRDDSKAFRDHVHRTMETIREGSSLVTFH